MVYIVFIATALPAPLGVLPGVVLQVDNNNIDNTYTYIYICIYIYIYI